MLSRAYCGYKKKGHTHLKMFPVLWVIMYQFVNHPPRHTHHHQHHPGHPPKQRWHWNFNFDLHECPCCCVPWRVNFDTVPHRSVSLDQISWGSLPIGCSSCFLTALGWAGSLPALLFIVISFVPYEPGPARGFFLLTIFLPLFLAWGVRLWCSLKPPERMFHPDETFQASRAPHNLDRYV